MPPCRRVQPVLYERGIPGTLVVCPCSSGNLLYIVNDRLISPNIAQCRAISRNIAQYRATLRNIAPVAVTGDVAVRACRDRFFFFFCRLLCSLLSLLMCKPRGV